jgi:hypothetical protein
LCDTLSNVSRRGILSSGLQCLADLQNPFAAIATYRATIPQN